MKRTILAATAGLAITLLSSSVRADLVFQEGLDGYAGTSDTYLLSSSGNQGSSTFVDIIGPGRRESHGLLRFDDIFGNGANQIRPGSRIESATLRLDTYFPSANTVFMHEMLIDWDENVITWDSAGNGIQKNNVEAKSDIAASFVSNGSFIEIDVTATLQNWSDGQANHGWAFFITAGNTDSYAFDSSETGPLAQRPKLTVEPAAIPEPGSFALAGVLITGAGIWRRLRRRAK